MDGTLPPGTLVKIIRNTGSAGFTAASTGVKGVQNLIDIRDVRGYLAYILVDCNDLNLKIRFELDGNSTTFALSELDTLGLTGAMVGHWWLGKVDNATPRFVARYGGPSTLEPFSRSLYVDLVNDSGATITLRQTEAKWYELPGEKAGGY